MLFVPFRAKRGETTSIKSVNTNFSRRNFYFRPKKSLNRQLQDRTSLNFNSGKIRILSALNPLQNSVAFCTDFDDVSDILEILWKFEMSKSHIFVCRVGKEI